MGGVDKRLIWIDGHSAYTGLHGRKALPMRRMYRNPDISPAPRRPCAALSAT
jgi:hypothetical protein